MPKFLFPIILLSILSIVSLFYFFLKVNPENQVLTAYFAFSFAVFSSITFTSSLLLLALSLLPQFLVKRLSKRTLSVSDEDLRKRFRLSLKLSFFLGLIFGFLTLLKLFSLLSIFNLVILLVFFLVFGYWWFFEK